MSILRDFEKRLEGAVEGFFARAFRSGLQPVELAKALQRYAANYQQVGLDGVLVPNVYRFVLSPDDMERFDGFQESLRRELAAVVTRTAQDRDWRLQGPVRIEIIEGEQIRTGTYELRGKVEAGEQPRPQPSRRFERAEPPPAPAPIPNGRGYGGGGTTVMPRSAAEAPALVSPGGRRYPINGTVTIGRLPECDVTVDDPAVSRRHARISHDGVEYTVEDLNSTNGVRVNGHPVTRAPLRPGDELDLGGARFTFSAGR
jgi:Protein of unknown function (DUF3662)/FHA domain